MVWRCWLGVSASMPAARPAVRTGRVIASPAPARCARQLCPNDRTSLRPIGLSGSKQTGPGIRKLTVARPQGSVAFWDCRLQVPNHPDITYLLKLIRGTSFAPLTTRLNQLNSHNIYGIAPVVNSQWSADNFAGYGPSLESQDGWRVPGASRSRSRLGWSCRNALGGCLLQRGVIGASCRGTLCSPIAIAGVRSPYSPRVADSRPRSVTHNDAGDRTHGPQDERAGQSAQCRISHALLSECPRWRQRCSHNHNRKKLFHVRPSGGR
jgi:hypothetical protein